MWRFAVGLLVLLQCMHSFGQIDLAHATGTVEEGADSLITLECSLATIDTSDQICGLGIVAGTDAENGYDFSDISQYTCTVLAGTLMGSVSIPLIDDPIMDDGEVLMVECASGATGGTAVTVTINENPLDTDQLMVVPRETFYKIKESHPTLPMTPSTVTVTVDVYDSNGKLAPFEAAIDINLLLPTASSSDTAEDMVDFTLPGTTNILASTDGIATTSALIEIVLMPDDDIPENLERFNIALSDATVGPTTTVDSAAIVTIEIADNDKRELICLNDMSPLPRRSKADITLWAITNEIGGSGNDISYTWMPHNLKDARDRDMIINDYPALETKIGRPKRNSKSRFNEYTYTKDQLFETDTYTRTVHAYLTPTSHTRKQAPIETTTRSTITVFPVEYGSDDLDKTYEISVPSNRKTNRELRWDFIPTSSAINSRIKLMKNKGRTNLKIKTASQAGLYIVYRKDRGKLGWEEYIRIIISVCPKNYWSDANPCDTETICQNGGLVDPVIGLCECRPGFAGKYCEIGLPPGTFGSNGEFKVRDITGGSAVGKCVMYCLPDPFGVSCGAGFGESNCCKECPTGTFGAGCELECHCVDSHCDRYTGECENGCDAGYSGDNCQTGP